MTTCSLFKGSSYLFLASTSLTAGYVTVRRDGNDSVQPTDMGKVLDVPEQHVIMISFKDHAPCFSSVEIYLHTEHYDSTTGEVTTKSVSVWKRRDKNSDFTRVYDTAKLYVEANNDFPNDFHLFFSFFSKSDSPQQLQSGKWNCSVDRYPRFRHHLACNLNRECEDGQDESADCPFSSPQCQGLVHFPPYCYQLLDNVQSHVSTQRDSNQRVNEICNSLGGIARVPTYAYDWHVRLRNWTSIHPYRLRLWTGLYVNDDSAPEMYRHSVVYPDRSVLHHAFPIANRGCAWTRKVCFTSDTVVIWPQCKDLQLKCQSCQQIRAADGTLCQFRTNKSEGYFYPSGIAISTSVQSDVFRTHHGLTQCHDGHLTYAFFLCSPDLRDLCDAERIFCPSSEQLHSRSKLKSTVFWTASMPTFQCSSEPVSLSFNLVCDFVPDCDDRSDEVFCEHPVCVNTFTCTAGQCVSYDKVCDGMSHCWDKSDEGICNNTTKSFSLQTQALPSPVLVQFDGLKQFVSTAINTSHPCPDTHYRCPGDFNDCLPVYTRCNGMYDCMGRHDEERCEELTCPGFFRCRQSTICVHRYHLCDSWPHCPHMDDELSCLTACPVHCQCQGHTFRCSQPFSAALFPLLRSLDASGSGMQFSDVQDNTYLLHLVLARCSLATFPSVHLVHLMILDLSGNQLQQVHMSRVYRLKNLHMLSLSDNPLTSLSTDLSSVPQHPVLTQVDLSGTTLTAFDSTPFSFFSRLQKLNLTLTSIHTISSGGFRHLPWLSQLELAGSPVKRFPFNMFQGLSRLKLVSTDNYKLCCRAVLLPSAGEVSCLAPSDELSSCEDLLQSWTYRVFLWLIVSLSILGNVCSFCARIFVGRRSSLVGFNVFVTNLTLADFLMGVYLAMIGAADERFRGTYLHDDDTWKSSVVCKVAGCLSLLSSEVSAITIWLITLDRVVVLRFPFSTFRFGGRSAAGACVMTWMLGCLFASVPLLPATSHWEFYSQTGICIPLPITQQHFKGRLYSISVLIVFNFLVFLCISAGQAVIYWSVQKSAVNMTSTKVSRDLTMARRLLSVAATDFVCWFPIGLCGLLSTGGTPIPGEVNAAFAIFILPINSALNPFMYTFNVLVEKRRKLKEAELIKWLKSCADITAQS